MRAVALARNLRRSALRAFFLYLVDLEGIGDEPTHRMLWNGSEPGRCVAVMDATIDITG